MMLGPTPLSDSSPMHAVGDTGATNTTRRAYISGEIIRGRGVYFSEQAKQQAEALQRTRTSRQTLGSERETRDGVGEGK